MTTKVILDSVVTTVLAIALGLALSIGAVSLIDKYLGPIDQAEAHYPGAPGQPARWVSKNDPEPSASVAQQSTNFVVDAA
jgi:hypothetical protein